MHLLDSCCVSCCIHCACARMCAHNTRSITLSFTVDREDYLKCVCAACQERPTAKMQDASSPLCFAHYFFRSSQHRHVCTMSSSSASPKAKHLRHLPAGAAAAKAEEQPKHQIERPRCPSLRLQLALRALLLGAHRAPMTNGLSLR
jgi:hypothetical protein